MGLDKVRSRRTMKFIRGALDVPLSKVAVPAGGGGGVDEEWYQVQLLNPPDSNDLVDASIAEHRSMKTYEIYFWYHQMALILDGEMVVQDVDTGEVYRGRKGDLFYWSPGLTIRLGGKFRALGIKTPVPLRWVKTPSGKKEMTMHLLDNEILLDGSPPDEVRKVTPKKAGDFALVKKMKFVRGATSAKPVKVDQQVTVGGDWWQVVLVDPLDTNLMMSAVIVNHPTKNAIVCDHRWHQVVLVLEGEMQVENLDTGEFYRAHKGDLYYWAPGLRHTVGGEFKVYAVRAPDPLRWVRDENGQKKEINLFHIPNQMRYPATPPDEVRKEPLLQA